MITFITGGVKSGKSAFALRLAESRFARKTYVATAVVEDDEMRERVRKHREERDGSYTTIEEPVDLHAIRADNIILDDITVWMGNLLHRGLEGRWRDILDGFFDGNDTGIIVISNETGWGNIPMDAMTRNYNRLLGEANAYVAERSDEAVLMVSGIPVRIKPEFRG